MSRTPFSGRLFDALASLRLAVVVMITLGIVCSVGTFYEMSHGTPAAQRDVYRTWWFALLLGMLGANIFCAMMKRYPWKSHHTGFVMAHIGILTLLAGSLISLHWGLDANMPLFEGETSDRVSMLDKALHVALPEHAAHGTFYVDFEKHAPKPGRELRYSIPGSDVALVAEEYLPHVEIRESFKEGAGGRPTLYFSLQGPAAEQGGWLVADDPERSHLDLGPAALGFHAAADAAQASELTQHAKGRNHVSFVLLPDGSLTYGITTRSGPGSTGKVEVGKPVQTPWMGMTVTVDHLLKSGVLRRRVTPAAPPAQEERRLSAVKIRLEAPAGKSESEWLVWTEEAQRLQFAGGEASVAYSSPQAVVPFRVTLLDFNSDKYPGSNMAATYESRVRIDDPERGVSEHHISMNEPMHYRGYIFFQASFVEGEPMMSIFSVARAPGLPLVYLGVTLISLGVAWMFYVKPTLARRQAARALAAHQREKADEAKPASAVPPSHPAEPARSGA